MKPRSTLIFVSIVITGSLLFVFAKLGAYSIYRLQVLASTSQKDQAGTINGADTPSAIPDHVAYEIFFTSLAPQPEGGDRAEGAVRAKLKQIGLSDADAAALRGLADQFKLGLSNINNQVNAMRDQNLSPEAPSTLAKLAELQGQKQLTIEELKDSIEERLTTDGALKVSQYVNEYVKRRIKIVPPSRH
jgi:hypothetical protein